MRMERAGHVYPRYRIKPDRALARALIAGLGFDSEPEHVPPTYMIFLRGETFGVDLFEDLDIPREKALHGGQRYEWFAPIAWDDELEVTTRIEKISEKQGKRGPIWFADVALEYHRVDDHTLVLRELTRLVKQS
jgi:N-terminal half of MaoC dehydratase